MIDRADAASADNRLGGFLVFLLFFSGCAGLIYEVLWLRTLQTVFGSTAYATSSVLATFFAGLSLGNVFWGRRCPRLKNPARVFGLLELAIAASALLYFLLLPLYQATLSSLYLLAGENVRAFFLVKLVLAAAVVFPPSFFMGGTLPVAIEHFLRREKELGKYGSLIYGVNTAGAATGALVAGFFLPVFFGYRNTYLLAVSLSVAVGGAMIAVSSRPSRRLVLPQALPALPLARWPIGRIEWVAFLSGFLTLGLEVLWTHLFAQVLQNSVYTFSAVLVVFILALGVGSFLAHLLCRLAVDPERVLWVLLVASGGLVGVSSFVFYHLTDGLSYLSPLVGWNRYLLSIFEKVVLSFGIPVAVMGAVFPYLLKLSEGSSRAGSGESLAGRLLAINTLGSILGSLVAGFFLIPALGSWWSVLALGLGYPLAALFWIPASAKRRTLYPAAAAAGAMLLLTLGNPSGLPIVRLEEGETLVESWEGSYGIVSVVDDGEGKRLKSNNHFGLGGYSTRATNIKMADLPIMLHPRPQTIFFEGMGTGITAGAALKYPEVERIVVSELVPEVITAARRHFVDRHALFDDPRVQVVAEDARNHLAYSAEIYDLIISDLFFPFQQGSGSLYSLEHFENVRTRLKTGGLFAQWLPAYQLSRLEFSIIAATMLRVFPRVTFWRSSFNAGQPVVALVGHLDEEPLAVDRLTARFAAYWDQEVPETVGEAFFFLFYAGNLSRAAELFTAVPVNRDDRPYIEYLAPISYTQAKTQALPWFSATTLAAFCGRVLEISPPESDPYLAELEPRHLDLVRAGADYLGAEASRLERRREEADGHIASMCARFGEEVCTDLIRRLRSPD